MGRDMPIGDCCVCDAELDLSDAGICQTCGQGFCWMECGEWHGGHHACFNCKPEDADEEDEDEDPDADGYDIQDGPGWDDRPLMEIME